MRRVQVQFSDKMHRRLKQRAAEEGKPVPEVVRSIVNKGMPQPFKRPTKEQREKALGIIGMFSSGLTDISARHDEYFVESILERKAHPKPDSTALRKNNENSNQLNGR